jgi:mannosidase alpha-like ER degradation enhancer 1
MRHGFPLDEVNPMSCSGQSRDYLNPSNLGINDVLGDYVLTLIDSLDTLALMGDRQRFRQGIQYVIQHVDFSQLANVVQVFESNIRILGGLLSAHLFATDPRFGVAFPEYQGELLTLAHDLGKRYLPAFEQSKTGIPYARVNLVRGVPPTETNETCTAGAGTLLLEFGVLSRLTGEDRFEGLARNALLELWKRRSSLNLVGNVINIQTGSVCT